MCIRDRLKIVLPQAIRYVIPSLISQLVVVVKDTTVAYVVSYPDMLQNARVPVSYTHLDVYKRQLLTVLGLGAFSVGLYLTGTLGMTATLPQILFYLGLASFGTSIFQLSLIHISAPSLSSGASHVVSQLET